MSATRAAPRPATAFPRSKLPEPLAAKLDALRARLQAFDGVLVAFSGGVDSSLLARVAHDLHGPRALAVTAVSAVMPHDELEDAIAVAAGIGIRHLVVQSTELDAEAFLVNPPNRCYVCKGIRFGALVQLAASEGLEAVVHGENADDANDYRPGVRAAVEAGVQAPLADAGLSKREVRALARALGLPNADKPAAPCLATRIPYGDRITLAALGRIERAEAALRAMGFGDLRVRHHGDVARIELPTDELLRAVLADERGAIVRELHAAGFRYVTLDLAGFRSGSLNEALADG